MNKIAIVGHSTRGKDIIKILKYLGGKMPYNTIFCGDNTYAYYFINNLGFIDMEINPVHMRDYKMYTLDTFLMDLIKSSYKSKNDVKEIY